MNSKIINSKNRKANYHYKELFAEEYSQTRFFPIDHELENYVLESSLKRILKIVHELE